jgi:hypothetical protein
MPTSTSVASLSHPPTPSRCVGLLRRVPSPPKSPHLHSPVVRTNADAFASVGTTVADKPNRTENINLRATPGEKTLIEENARKAGRKVGAYLRDRGIEGAPVQAALAQVGPKAKREVTNANPDHQRRVNIAARRMSRRNAERLVSREEAAKRARSALRR